MITAQDIREKAFEKARFNGYDMAGVDEFLEELADEIGGLQKENASLKAKMKVLVDKIEEYRANEEALNLAVLSAQKLAVQIESEARTRASAIVADAERQASARIGGISAEADSEQKRLDSAKAASSKFLQDIRSKFNSELSSIEAIITGIGPVKEEIAAAPAKEPAAPAVAEEVEEAVRSIEDSVSRIQPEPAFKLDLSSAMEAPAAKNGSDFDSTQQFSF